MSLRLVIVEGPGMGTQLVLDTQPTLEIGRSPAADLTLLDPHAADIHLKLYRDGATYACYDVTGAGFLHNNQRSLKAQLAVGDVVKVGGVGLRLLSDSAAPATSAQAPAAAPRSRGPGPVLQALKGNDAGKTFQLQKSVVILGRGNSTDITIWDIRASRAHCRIDRLQDGFMISDLNSSNGTQVNGQKITTHRLSEGDMVRIGATVLRFSNAG